MRNCKRTLFVVLAGAAILLLPALSAAAGIISFNLQGGRDYIISGGASPQSNGMVPADVAGAPGVNVGNWNNIFSDYRTDNLLVPAPTSIPLSAT